MSSERTGWRDAWISDWHQRQHRSLCMSDIDFLAVEMTGANNPVAIVDYKRMRPRSMESTVALRGCNNLANSAQIPFFIVFYNEVPTFTVQPINRFARWFVKQEIEMSEYDYVRLLFVLRGDDPPVEALWNLNRQTSRYGETA